MARSESPHLFLPAPNRSEFDMALRLGETARAAILTKPVKVDPRVPLSWPRVQLAGVPTDLLEYNDAINLIMSHASNDTGRVLGVVSANLDHLHHFGSGRTTARLQRKAVLRLSMDQAQWLNLLDGAPLVRKAGELTGRRWPRLAGSELIEPLLDEAERRGLSVGFLGGSPETHDDLRPQLERRWPRLRVAGFWSPSRAVLDNPTAARQLAQEISLTKVNILAVCLGKPRQERWIAEHGAASGAKVCLAFGAVVDFLAGRVNRAPKWVSDHGLEWAWRLGIEPRRLARRYLIQGPPAFAALQRDSFVKLPTTYFAEPVATPHPTAPRFEPHGTFAPPGTYADVSVIVVTHNNEADIDELVASLRRQLGDQSLRVIIVDNASTDATTARVADNADVILVNAPGNLGYAAGINLGRRQVGECGALLILNPDLIMEPGSLRAMRERLLHPRVGVCVPRLLDVDGEVYASVRREPTLTRAIGDALLGERLSGRPGWLSEIELDRRTYRYAHRVDWATGAALLIAAEVDEAVGDWDERYFLYSEEVDYLRRVRETGTDVWFEPLATMQHARGGSGSTDELESLMAVNRVRYQEWNGGKGSAMIFRSVVTLASVLRAKQSRHRAALRYLVSRRRWSTLPSARAAGE
jgi:exopolysaccharide biosynthesis WecB/TagA/CpsF family protein